MAHFINKRTDASFTTNILIKKENGLFIAHCLELDIVAVDETLAVAEQEIVSLISAQIDYAFSNDNIDHLFHPAPSEAWQEFYRCKKQVEKKYEIKPLFKNKTSPEKIVPLWLITKTCESENTFLYA